MDIITKAKTFAARAHKDQVRNDKQKTPYIFHLEEVANLVKDSGGKDQEIAAAWLHDIVEDTPITIEGIREEFGVEIGDIVEGLTDKTEWLSLSLHERKTKQAERIAKESDSVKLIKLADQTSNVRITGLLDDNFNFDEKFIYIDRAKEIAEACKGVSPYLDEVFQRVYQTTYDNLASSHKLSRS